MGRGRGTGKGKLIHVATTFTVEPGVLKRNLVKYAKKACEEVVVDWHNKTLVKHFQVDSQQRYGYEPRKRKSMIRKAKKWGHQRMLVNNPTDPKGILNTIRNMGFRVRATAGRGTKPSQATLIMRGPSRLKEQYQREIRMTTGEETQLMAEAIHRSVTKQINDAKRGAAGIEVDRG